MSRVDSTWNRLMVLFEKDRFSNGDKLQLLLNSAVDALDLSVGSIAYIQDDRYTIYDSTDKLLVGHTLSTRQTFCLAPYRYGQPLALHAVRQTLWRKQPAYDIFAYETYLGLPLKVGYQVFGTVYFADYQARRSDFSEREIAFGKMIAGMIGTTIATRSTKPLPEGFELVVQPSPLRA